MLDALPDDRATWMGVLARAPVADLARLWVELAEDPPFTWLRRPETGTVMLRGRAGATGAPFNLGEMTVTRAALRLEAGAVGHAMVQGRSADHARLAALVDALLHTPAADRVRKVLISPLAQAETDRRAGRAAKAAATRVEFFTLVRGEG